MSLGSHKKSSSGHHSDDDLHKEGKRGDRHDHSLRHSTSSVSTSSSHRHHHKEDDSSGCHASSHHNHKKTQVVEDEKKEDSGPFKLEKVDWKEFLHVKPCDAFSKISDKEKEDHGEGDQRCGEDSNSNMSPLDSQSHRKSCSSIDHHTHDDHHKKEKDGGSRHHSLRHSTSAVSSPHHKHKDSSEPRSLRHSHSTASSSSHHSRGHKDSLVAGDETKKDPKIELPQAAVVQQAAHQRRPARRMDAEARSSIQQYVVASVRSTPHLRPRIEHHDSVESEASVGSK